MSESIEYNRFIHAQAMAILEERENRSRYEKDCLAAGLCAKCGHKLITQISERRRDAMGLLDETVCVKCGYLAQLN